MATLYFITIKLLVHNFYNPSVHLILPSPGVSKAILDVAGQTVVAECQQLGKNLYI